VTDPRIETLLAKQEIHDRLMLYVRGVDRFDGELISQAFHPDAVADHGQFVFTAEQVGEVIPKLEEQVQMGMHFLGNELIEVAGDEAYVEVYFLTFAEVDRDGETYHMARGARYCDLWERRDGEWKISYRIIVVDWGTISPVLERWPGADLLHGGHRSHEDPVFRIKELAAAKADRVESGAETVRAFMERMSSAGFGTGSEGGR
jgi:hypothetical protein